MAKEKVKRNLSILGLVSLIVVLVVLIVETVTMFIRYENLGKINNQIEVLSNPERALDIIQTTSIELNDVNSNFRLFILTGQEEFNDNYKTGINSVKESFSRLKQLMKKNSIDSFESIFSDKIILEKSYIEDFFALKEQGLENSENLVKKENEIVQINMELSVQLKSVHEILEKSHSEDGVRNRRLSIFEISGSIKKIAAITLLSFLIIMILIIVILLNVRNMVAGQKQLIKAKIAAEEDSMSKERFLAYMSHELRTPLFVISGFVEQLKSTKLNEKQFHYLNITSQSVETLLLTVNDILDHTSLLQGKLQFNPQEFTIKQVMSEMKGGFEYMFTSKDIDFEIIINGNENLVMSGDTFRLKQVFNNLLSNAQKFSNGGKVTIRCTIEEYQGEAKIHTEVEDQGIGIPKDGLAELFQEYAQFHNLKASWRQGTGLGLSICKRILKLQGGKIWAESELGKGSVFTFEINYPIIKQSEQAFNGVRSDIDISKLKGLKVLFTDDNQLNVLLFKTMVNSWEIEYDIALNGAKALKLIQQNNYDVIFTDIFMPNMDGLELTREIRKTHSDRYKNVPIIAITAEVMNKDIELYRKSGMNDYMFKPFKSIDLYNMLIKYYKSGTYSD